MAENIASAVNWYGPYNTIAEARKAAQSDYKDGLYAIIGYNPDASARRKELLYVGVGAPLSSRLIDSHHKMGSMEIAQIWLGEISSPKKAGKRLKKIEPHLDIVEWMIAYFLCLPNNEKKRASPPDSSGVILNRWFKAEDYETSLPRPVARWADVIEYDAGYGTANLVWFGRRGRVKNIKDVTALRISKA